MYKDDLYFCYLTNYVECGALAGSWSSLSLVKYGECMFSCWTTEYFRVL